jgi:biopolymer transport protein ExbD
MTAGNRKGILADPNVVPLIDILLVLIIIFMVIQPPALSTGHKALVPQPPEDSSKIPPPPEDVVIVVQVLDGGALKINNEAHTWESLGPRLETIFKQRAEKVAFVKGDDAVLFEQVARAIDVMRSSGADRIGLLTAKMAAGR